MLSLTRLFVAIGCAVTSAGSCGLACTAAPRRSANDAAQEHETGEASASGITAATPTSPARVHQAKEAPQESPDEVTDELAEPEPPKRYPFHEPLPDPNLASAAPAMRFANLAPWQCRQQVQKGKLPLKRDGRPTPGVATALRFTGPIDDVTFLTAGWKTPWAALDCRLALAFAELTGVLREHSVKQVTLGTMYRKKARLSSNKPSQHAYGLAADVVSFTLENGRTLALESDWKGEIGVPPCGPESELSETTEEAVALRNLVCDIARRGFFHYMLTPNYDQAHHDHLHVDIKRGEKRSFIR